MSRFRQGEKVFIAQYIKAFGLNNAVYELANKLGRTKQSIYFYLYRNFGKVRNIDWTNIDEDICKAIASNVDNLGKAFDIVARKHGISCSAIKSRWYSHLKNERKVFRIEANYCGMSYNMKPNCKNRAKEKCE